MASSLIESNPYIIRRYKTVEAAFDAITPTVDTDFNFTIGAGEKWLLEYSLFVAFGSNATEGMTFEVGPATIDANAPAMTGQDTFIGSVFVTPIAWSSSLQIVAQGAGPFNLDLDYTTLGASEGVWTIKLLAEAGSVSKVLQTRFATLAADESIAYVYPGSHLVAHRVS